MGTDLSAGMRFAAVLLFAVGSATLVSVGVRHVPVTPEGNFYSTNFAKAETPISENGRWTNGKATGVDWSDVVTTAGLAHGTQTGSDGFNDSLAVLTGAWGPDQYARAVVHTVNQVDVEEVELLLRFTITPYSAQGYEINFSCSRPNGYTEIVRWNGPLGNFTYVQQKIGPGLGVQNGDVIEATIVGNVITVYKNRLEVNRAIDNNYSTGNPGIAFFNRDATSARNADFGLTSYTASNNPIDATLSETHRHGDSPIKLSAKDVIGRGGAEQQGLLSP